jgi:hypothetical protein
MGRTPKYLKKNLNDKVALNVAVLLADTRKYHIALPAVEVLGINIP